MTAGPSPKNKLNDLSNGEWTRETKSFWLSRAPGPGEEASAALVEFREWLLQHRDPEQVEALLQQLDDSFVYSQTPPRSKLKALHPATFSERDVERLIRLFTKAGETVLDPFVGSGSALVACAACGRRGVGIELSPQWASIARERLRQETASPHAEDGSCDLRVITGDVRQVLPTLAADSFDFVVTSPPYWSILTKRPGLKVKAERTERGLPTQYSEDPSDLGNMASYEEFLQELAEVFGACRRVLKPRRYMAVVVSDFRHGPRFYLYHADLAREIEARGLALRGLTILAQDNKNLYPYGVPNAFVSNIHHQYILIFQRPDH